LKLQTSNLANHHLDVIKQLKELQFRILDQELNRWKRDQQLSGNGAPFTNNLDTIQKWCEDLAEIIWINMQQIRQLEMIQEQLNIPSQELTVNILPELSDGLTMLLDSLVKSSFVIGNLIWFSNLIISNINTVKFIYSEKATKFCEIFTLLLTVCTVVKS
jgi:hypothetical protein